MKTALLAHLPAHLWKYILVSAVSTGVDFSFYFMLGELTVWPASDAALFGAAVGGAVSWALNQFWVFSHAKGKKRRTALRYLVGIGLGVVLNGAATGFFCEVLEMPRMAGRVAAAVGAWAAIYWFNRRVVFHA